MVSSHAYGHNLLNQRVEATLEDGSRWQYQYDSKGQLTAGQRKWGDDTLVAGQRFGYSFDDIGNRTAAAVNGRQSTYTANELNQYTERSVPGAVDVQGSAAATAAVAVNSQTAQRKGEYFYREVSVDNQDAPQYPQIRVQAMQAGAAPGGSDLVSERTGRLYVPQTPEEFVHDADGNLTRDGRWSYTWDGENRLVAMESLAVAPAEAKKRLEFEYDAQGRRIRKRTYQWNGTDYVPQTERRFLYDGWNMVAELDGLNILLRTCVWGVDLSGSQQGAGGVVVCWSSRKVLKATFPPTMATATSWRWCVAETKP